MNFKDKIVLITGGSRGIGLELVNQFHKLGARVISTATREENFPACAEEKNISFLAVNFLKGISTLKFLSDIEEVKVDILINNAGIFYSDEIGRIDEQLWNDIIQVNLTAPMLISNVVVKGMKKRMKGKIINISSIAANVSRKGHAAYSASKAGLNGLTRACALDLAPYNIMVNAVCPSTTNTEMTKNGLTTEQILTLIGKVPSGSLVSVDEIAKLVMFLASGDNTNITGQAIIIDGGFTSQ